MALPLPLTPTAAGSPALTPNTRSEAEAALSYNVLHQTSSASGIPPRIPLHQRHPSHNYLDAATAAGLDPQTCEAPYPTEDTARRVSGTLSRGTTQAVLAKMESITKTDSVSKEHTHVSFDYGTDGGLLGKRMSREGERRTSSITVPVPASGGVPAVNVVPVAGEDNANRGVEGGGVALGNNVPSIFGAGDSTGDIRPKPTFAREQSWKREDAKRALYQQERLMETEWRHGKNFGFESGNEDNDD